MGGVEALKESNRERSDTPNDTRLASGALTMARPVTPPAIRVTHIVPTLELGGAEMVLRNLIAGSHPDRLVSDVIVLLRAGPLADLLTPLGVRVRVLGIRGHGLALASVLRLFDWIRRDKPDVVQTWMYHANVLGGLAAQAARIPVTWGIHIDGPYSAGSRATTRLAARSGQYLSRTTPSRIVCCSPSAMSGHATAGFAAHKMTVISNGFDTQAFRPDPAARVSVRQELGVSPAAPLVGMVARFHEQKDHRTFLRAAGIVRSSYPGVHFVLCGANVEPSNQTLNMWVRESALNGRAHLLGIRSDLPRVMAALDVLCLSSLNEGLPMVLGEAMACGVTCVATDVGDCKTVLGDTGIVVGPRDPSALASAIAELLASPSERASRGSAARRRVEEHFSLRQMVSRYESVYRELAEMKARNTRGGA